MEQAIAYALRDLDETTTPTIAPPTSQQP